MNSGATTEKMISSRFQIVPPAQAMKLPRNEAKAVPTLMSARKGSTRSLTSRDRNVAMKRSGINVTSAIRPPSAV